jgi:hypothetical protein
MLIAPAFGYQNPSPLFAAIRLRTPQFSVLIVIIA